jgi:ribosomal protection tetracycline resistance protein
MIFVNKIDRVGAADDRVLAEIADRLTPAIVSMGTPTGLGTRTAGFTLSGPSDAPFRSRLAETLADRDEAILAAFVDDEQGVPYDQLGRALADQAARALVHPVFFGSAMTGAGVDALMGGIAELLPAAAGDADAPASGQVFKIERAPAGEKIAYARMFAGTVRTRDRLRFGQSGEGKVTAVAVFDRGSAEQRPSASAGEIAKLWGLAAVQIGDTIGSPTRIAAEQQFAPPTLESVVVPASADDGAQLRVALGPLAEQDPLIAVRQDDERRELSVCLYGEVQKEVIQAMLAADFGLDVAFRETTVICVERAMRSAEAVEILHAESNPFAATIGLRVDPAPVDSGVDFHLDVDTRTVPLYLYKTAGNFAEAMGEHVRRALREGLHGWQVTDCTVTMTRCTYQSADGPPSTRGPLSTLADFRNLTPIVLMEALERAGTVVCEPVVQVRVEVPAAAIGAILAALARLGAVARAPSLVGELSMIETVMPAARVRELQRQLPALTGGEGVLESDFAGYQPVGAEPPTRRRTTANPLNREEYLMRLARRVAVAG